LRLAAYDYTQPGAYFVTVCTADRACVLGHVADGSVVLNNIGLIVQDTWTSFATRYPGAAVDEFVVMPNHVHAIVLLWAVDAPLQPTPPGRCRDRPLQ